MLGITKTHFVLLILAVSQAGYCLEPVKEMNWEERKRRFLEKPVFQNNLLEGQERGRRGSKLPKMVESYESTTFQKPNLSGSSVAGEDEIRNESKSVKVIAQKSEKYRKLASKKGRAGKAPQSNYSYQNIYIALGLFFVLVIGVFIWRQRTD